jgi:hypothetical protein
VIWRFRIKSGASVDGYLELPDGRNVLSKCSARVCGSVVDVPNILVNIERRVTDGDNRSRCLGSGITVRVRGNHGGYGMGTAGCRVNQRSCCHQCIYLDLFTHDVTNGPAARTRSRRRSVKCNRGGIGGTTCAFVNATRDNLIGSAADYDPIIYPNTINGTVIITVKGNSNCSTSVRSLNQRGAAEGNGNIRYRNVSNIMCFCSFQLKSEFS